MVDIGKERRRFPRIKVALIVRYKILDTPEQEYEVKTKDISAGGVCLVTHEQLKSGTILAMEIKFLPAEDPVLAAGRVVWSKESSLGLSPAGHKRFDNGIEFEKISDVDRGRIIELVKSEQEKTKTKGWKIGIVRDISKSK